MRSAHVARWSRPDVDARALWRASGAEWLTAPGVPTPDELVAEVVGLVEHLDARIADPASRLVTISVAQGVGLLAERAAAVGLAPSNTVSCGGATRLLAASDDRLAVTLARDDDIEMVAAWLEIDPPARGDHWKAVEVAVAQRRSAELLERAVLLGLPVSRVAEESRLGGAGSSRESGVLVEPLARRPASTVDGLVVMNLGSLWAGPLAADVLARLGARVITVESLERPDGSRATLGFFESLHGRTESVALPFRSEVGRRRLAALLAHADVVIEGSRPRALEQLGIRAVDCVRRSGQIWVSITGHGRFGAAADRVGFGDDSAVAGGLVGWLPDGPCFLADAVADPVAGLTAAATVVDLVEAGSGAIVDVSLARVAAGCASAGAGTSRATESADPGPGDSATRGSLRPERPQRRRDAGGALPLGCDTDRVLADFGISVA